MGSLFLISGAKKYMKLTVNAGMFYGNRSMSSNS
jgi:hypothetical protein